ncbi:hypothetical protein DTO166G4_1724 [Paecilomyces variotii]|nr:hypothetical protein DTO166G4_1724 [Paecilomyces variotii]KAJ9239480.1 hypothetical protein DTO166G5_2227 [Paecilomyces variotii]KAJ9264488.1 hypothetical protein DTO195F2_2305 [Paecilomyces variotii]KAJ9358902.1 hypothetical protein DTO027B9_2197 [Paecilomyces variotii]KAJ9402340.1 hypothetical protein DTO282F9_536 [Paecilomyces variotii]
MSIDEMLERYPKIEVERAVFDRDFTLHRAQTIAGLQESINRGINVDICRQTLDEIDHIIPPQAPFYPDVPKNLDPDVIWRIGVLRYAYRNGSPAPALAGLMPEEDMRNISAVLDAYRRGELKVDVDKVTVWFAGRMVLGPCVREGLWDKIRSERQAWSEAYGESQPWVEDVVPLRQR